MKTTKEDSAYKWLNLSLLNDNSVIYIHVCIVALEYVLWVQQLGIIFLESPMLFKREQGML